MQTAPIDMQTRLASEILDHRVSPCQRTQMSTHLLMCRPSTDAKPHLGTPLSSEGHERIKEAIQHQPLSGNEE